MVQKYALGNCALVTAAAIRQVDSLSVGFSLSQTVLSFSSLAGIHKRCASADGPYGWRGGRVCLWAFVPYRLPTEMPGR